MKRKRHKIRDLTTRIQKLRSLQWYLWGKTKMKNNFVIANQHVSWKLRPKRVKQPKSQKKKNRVFPILYNVLGTL